LYLLNENGVIVLAAFVVRLEKKVFLIFWWVEIGILCSVWTGV